MSAARTAPRPSVLDDVVRFVATEYASLTAAGRPITWPVTPYRGTDGATIDVSTGLTYPLKAERARRDPRVALCFSFPLGSGLADPATVVVQGLATVRDADLRATSRRYLEESMARFPEAFGRIPSFLLARMAWYWARVWVAVTPTRVRWWPGGDLSQPPREWRAPEGTTAPPSDPAPAGRSSGSWSPHAADWRRRSDGVIERLGLPVVTVVDDDGWPLPVPVRDAGAVEGGFDLVPPAGMSLSAGPAFLSFHSHGEVFDGQENVGLAGTATVEDGHVHVRVERALADFGVPKNPVRNAWRMLTAGRRLAPRLEAEAARRGQRVPTWADVRPLK